MTQGEMIQAKMRRDSHGDTWKQHDTASTTHDTAQMTLATDTAEMRHAASHSQDDTARETQPERHKQHDTANR
eukprot:397456-Rhodomonas_salina.2